MKERMNEFVKERKEERKKGKRNREKTRTVGFPMMHDVTTSLSLTASLFIISFGYLLIFFSCLDSILSLSSLEHA